jgi:uncharacterized membrane protein
MSAKRTLKDVINHAKNIRVARGTSDDVRALAAEVEKLAGAVLQLERDRTSHLRPAVADASEPTDGMDEPAASLPPWRPGAAA